MFAASPQTTANRRGRRAAERAARALRQVRALSCPSLLVIAVEKMTRLLSIVHPERSSAWVGGPIQPISSRSSRRFRKLLLLGELGRPRRTSGAVLDKIELPVDRLSGQQRLQGMLHVSKDHYYIYCPGPRAGNGRRHRHCLRDLGSYRFCHAAATGEAPSVPSRADGRSLQINRAFS